MVYLEYIFIVLIQIAGYVLTGISLYAIGKRRALRLYGMAWVPIGSEWLLGSVADQYDRKTGKKNLHLGTVLLIGKLLGTAVIAAVFAFLFTADEAVFTQPFSQTNTALVIVFGAVLIVGLLAYRVFYCIAIYKVFSSCTPKHAAWMLILTIVCAQLLMSFAEPICLLCIRKKDGGFEELKEEEPAEELQEFTYSFDQSDSEEE